MSAKMVALVAMMTATIEAGKIALAWLPNIEVVTLLCGVYGYVFGWLGILATILFVVIETMIWGVNTWVLSYFIYWPLVAGIFMFLNKLHVKNRWIITAVAVTLTVFFGVLTSLVDVGLFSGLFDNFWKRFATYYVAGTWFYVAQIACNAIVFPALFIPLKDMLIKLKKNFIQNKAVRDIQDYSLENRVEEGTKTREEELENSLLINKAKEEETNIKN